MRDGEPQAETKMRRLEPCASSIQDAAEDSARADPPAAAPAPPIDVVLTCHNEEAHIAAAVRSVLAQTAIGLVGKIIVVDDGSLDGSPVLLDALEKEDSRIAVHHIANRGISGARNFGLGQSKSPFVAFLDGDDLWHPRKLELQWQAVGRCGERCALWYTDFIDFVTSPELGTPINVRAYRESDKDFLTRYFKYDGPILPSSAFLRRSALDSVNLFDESIKLFEDLDLWLRLGKSYRVQHVPGMLTLKRRHADSLSANYHRWEGALDIINERAVAMEPSLAASVKTRSAYRLAKLAYAYAFSGEDREARAALIRSLKINPFSVRAIAYLGALCVPRSLRHHVILAIKRPAHASLAAIRNDAS